MPIGKSKISDMDFGSFENTIEKNIEADKASDKFDQQLQAYKDAGNSLSKLRLMMPIWNRQSTTGTNSLAMSPNFLKTTEKRIRKSLLAISMTCLI